MRFIRELLISKSVGLEIIFRVKVLPSHVFANGVNLLY